MSDLLFGLLNTARSALTAKEANCQVKFGLWPTTGTAITNQGIGGSGYNGVAHDNDYHLLPSGATSFSFDTSADFVKIPKGAAINNLAKFTIELFLNIEATVTDFTDFYYKNGANGVGLEVWVSSTRVVMQRYMSDGSRHKYQTNTNAIPAAGDHVLQISWDASAPAAPADPIIKVDNVLQTINHVTVGTGTAWSDDSNYDAYICNDASAASWLKSILALARVHNTNLSSADLTYNFNFDQWRIVGA